MSRTTGLIQRAAARWKRLLLLVVMASQTSLCLSGTIHDVIPGQAVHLKGQAQYLRSEITAPSAQAVFDHHLDNESAWNNARVDSINEVFRYGLFWQKIQIHNPGSKTARLLFVCTESTTTNLHVAIVRNGMIVERWLTGSAQPYNTRTISHRKFLLPFELAPDETVTILSGMESAGDGDFLWIIDQKSYWQWDNKNLIIDSVQFGAISILSLLLMMLFIVTRDKMTLYLYLFVVNSMIHNLCRDGFLDQFLYPGLGSITHPLSEITVCLSFLFAILFFCQFLDYRQRQSRWILRFSSLAIWLNALIIFAVLTTDAAIHTPWVVVSALLSVVYFITVWVISIIDARKGHYHSKVFAWIGTFGVFPLFISVMYFFFHPASQPPFWLRSRSGEVLFTVGLYVALLYDLRRQQLERQAALLEAEARTQFFATMNHELRTPLNGVIGTAELLNQTEQTPIQKKYSDTIISSGNLLLTLINDILDLTKMSEGKLELENKPYNLDQTLSDCIASFLPSVILKQVPIFTSFSPTMPINLIGDQYRVRQVIYNLLSNAMKFTDRGEIVLSVRAEATNDPNIIRIILSVKDTGVGIDSESIEKIFNQFSQADVSTTRKFGGSGLGLAICKAIITQMNGTINAESQPGKGSTFTISYLSEVDQSSEKSRDSSLSILQGKHVLAMTDLPRSLEFMSEYFQHWGLHLTIAPSKSHAHQLLKENHYDCLLVYFFHNSVKKLSEYANYNINVLLWHHEPIANTDIHWNAKLVTLPVPSPVYKTAEALKSLFTDTPFRQKRQHTDGSLEALHALDILVVEDNPTNKMVALGMLRNLGFSADFAENGKQAVEMCERHHYALIFMDCEMPVLDGYEAARRILEQSQHPKPVIIALTAQSMESARQRCFDAGMQSILYKPITLNKLEDCLKKVKESADFSG